MNLITTAATVTMTSREIADLTGKQHQHIKRDIEKMFSALGLDASTFGHIYTDASNRKQTEYRLPKRETLILVSGYDTVLRAKVVDRVAELEQQNVPKTPAHMLLAMAQQFLAYEQEQQRQSTEIARIQESVAVIEARTQPENKHFTVLGYANLIGKRIDLKEAAKLGKKCAELSRTQGIQIGDVRDPRFGNVHSYHESILQAVMDSEVSA